MSTTPKPLFLFSLPRSGSTLCQRILGTDPKIATAAEPWILLPYLYTLRKQGTYTLYSHNSMAMAIEDFCMLLPNGQDDYLAEIRTLALRLYEKASKASHPDAQYFLDKTPRYSLIADDICRMFPDGKFLFLWRNPLAVIASIIETWGKGRWNLYTSKIELFQGLESLLVAYQNNKNRSCAFRYEDIISDPETYWRKIYEYLDLPFQSSVLTDFSETHLKGRMGDQTGIHQYHTLSSEPLSKWKTILANPLRKAWCRRYLHWIGQERLALMGYDLSTLLNELRSIPTRPHNLMSDVLWMSLGFIHPILETVIIRDKINLFKSRASMDHFHTHT